MTDPQKLAAVEAVAVAVESRVNEALDRGEVPVLDAVETLRLLRAILDGAPEYAPDIARFKVRSARMQVSPSNPIARSLFFAADVAWHTAGEGGAS